LTPEKYAAVTMEQTGLIKKIGYRKTRGKAELPKLKWLADVEDDLRDLKVKIWRQRANNRAQLAYAVKDAKYLRGRFTQTVSA
jgi:hypothetical protein